MAILKDIQIIILHQFSFSLKKNYSNHIAMTFVLDCSKQACLSLHPENKICMPGQHCSASCQWCFVTHLTLIKKSWCFRNEVSTI